MPDNQTILIIDDDELSLKVTTQHLSDDYPIHTCSDPRQAYSFIEQLNPALILLDLEMPEIDGLTILKQLKTNGDTANIPVIIITSHDTVDDELQALRLGASDFIAKPAQKHILNIRVKNQLSLFSEQKKNMALIKKLTVFATTDPITNLYNRFRFIELAERELYRAKRYVSDCSLIMLDIDHFKVVNDTFGHAAGDKVLTALAQIMTKELREVDVIGRLGGEEFAILLPETSLSQASVLAERIRLSIENNTIAINEQEGVNITVSQGVCTLNETLNTLDDMLNRADVLLYQSKNNGRNQVTLDS